MLRLYFNADGALHRVVDLDQPDVAAEDLPDFDDGQTTALRDRAMPDARQERWDAAANGGAGDFVPIPPPPPPVRTLSQRGWMMRFTRTEREDYRLVLKGKSPTAVYPEGHPEAGEPTPLGARLQARAEDLYELLHADERIRPDSETALGGLQILASLSVVAADRIPVIHVPVTDEDVAAGWGA